MKNIRIFYLKIFNFLGAKFSIYLNRRVYVLCSLSDSLLYTYLTLSILQTYMQFITRIVQGSDCKFEARV